MLVRKQNDISVYKAKATLYNKESLSYGAVVNAISGIDSQSKKSLMSKYSSSKRSGKFGHDDKE